MIINVLYGDEYVDIIEVPVNDMNIQCVYEEFVKWVQNLDSGYHIMQNGTVVGVWYDIGVFINWLNKNYFSQKNKAKILKKMVCNLIRETLLCIFR